MNMLKYYMFDMLWLARYALWSRHQTFYICNNIPLCVVAYRIRVEHWKDRNVRGGYYSWIKAVHLELYNVGYNISLLQNHVVLVNGVAMKQYHNTHIVSVARILDQVVSFYFSTLCACRSCFSGLVWLVFSGLLVAMVAKG